MHEFAYGITNENPHYGPARNPWDLDRITGGSSGGSAAALAMGIGYAATGTDTGGSIRIPAALCGVVGLKPTFGLVSVEGVVPLAKTLDHAGPMARSVTDVCIILDAIAGDYPQGAIRPDPRKLRKSRPRKFRIGWPKQYFFERIDREVHDAIESAAKCFKSLGATINQVSLPGLEHADRTQHEHRACRSNAVPRIAGLFSGPSQQIWRRCTIQARTGSQGSSSGLPARSRCETRNHSRIRRGF